MIIVVLCGVILLYFSHVKITSDEWTDKWIRVRICCGFVGEVAGMWRLALSNPVSLWYRDLRTLSIKRVVSSDIDYKLLRKGRHTTRIVIATGV